MCGRYSGTIDPAELAAMIPLDACIFEYQPRYNIAPTQAAPVIVRQEGRTVLKAMRWGLIPSWADDEKIGPKLINARVETAAQKPAFRAAWKARRCLVPVDGFYEWERREGRKQPWHFHLKDRSQFCFAGLWETWRRPPDEQGDLFANPIAEAAPLETFTIFTTAPNRLVGKFHDRMPVMLPSARAATWLGDDGEAALSETISAEAMACHPVSSLVNSPRTDQPDCLLPLNTM